MNTSVTGGNQVSDEQKTPARPEATITFRGREMKVRFPQPEQLMVWQRLMNKLSTGNISDWNAQQVMSALERTRKIIDSILVDEADIEWLDDEMMDGNIGLQEASEILIEATKAFGSKGQTPAKKSTATRRKS